MLRIFSSWKRAKRIFVCVDWMEFGSFVSWSDVLTYDVLEIICGNISLLFIIFDFSHAAWIIEIVQIICGSKCYCNECWANLEFWWNSSNHQKHRSVIFYVQNRNSPSIAADSASMMRIVLFFLVIYAISIKQNLPNVVVFSILGFVKFGINRWHFP